jgi:DNA repair ATPase RecN
MGQVQATPADTPAVSQTRTIISQQIYKTPYKELDSNQRKTVEKYQNSLRKYASTMWRKPLNLEEFTAKQLKLLYKLGKLDFQINNITNKTDQKREQIQHRIFTKQQALQQYLRVPRVSVHKIDKEVALQRLQFASELENELEELNRELSTLTESDELQKLTRKRDSLIEIDF